jgi:hypothetical protein
VVPANLAEGHKEWANLYITGGGNEGDPTPDAKSEVPEATNTPLPTICQREKERCAGRNHDSAHVCIPPHVTSTGGCSACKEHLCMYVLKGVLRRVAMVVVCAWQDIKVAVELAVMSRAVTAVLFQVLKLFHRLRYQ